MSDCVVMHENRTLELNDTIREQKPSIATPGRRGRRGQAHGMVIYVYSPRFLLKRAWRNHSGQRAVITTFVGLGACTSRQRIILYSPSNQSRYIDYT